MKTPLLLTLAALTAFGMSAHAQDTPPPPLVPPAPPAAPAAPAAPVPPSPSKPGKAIITIDLDGRRETRELELSDARATQITIGRPGKNQTIAIKTDGSLTDHHQKSVWLGVTPDEVPESLRSQLSLAPDSGLLLRAVAPDSPAARAGLQKDDVLTRFDDQLLLSEQQLHGLLKAKHDGDTVTFGYIRRAQPGVIEVKLGTHQSSFGAGDASDEADGSDFGEQISKDVNAVVKNAMKTALNSLDQSKAIMVDKAGKMVKLLSDDMVDVDTTLDTVDKTMRRAGVDEKTIADTKRQIADDLKRNEHSLERAQDGLKKAADGLKKAAAAQAKADDDGNDN